MTWAASETASALVQPSMKTVTWNGEQTEASVVDKPDAVATIDTTGMTVEQAVDAVTKACLASGAKTDYEKALWLHDWLIYHANYDYTYTEYGPEGVLLKKTGVCQSYGLAYELLLDKLGIESIFIVSVAMNHGWNLVKLDGVWCHIDCTWDDPGTGGYENHNYFGLSDALMLRDHTWEGTYPAANSLQNVYAVRMGTAVTDVKSLYTYLEKKVNSKATQFEINYIGLDPSFSLSGEFSDWFMLNMEKYGLAAYSMTMGENYVRIRLSYFNGGGTPVPPVDPDPPVDPKPPVQPEPDPDGWVNPFVDVEKKWYYEAVKYCSQNGYINGMSSNTFAPSRPMTRGMLVTILYRVAGSPDVSGVQNPFADVPNGKYYTKPTLWAYQNGVVNGLTATTFGPDQNVSREQLVTIFFRFDKASALEGDRLARFPDAAQVSKFARPGFNWAVETGLVGGNKIGTQLCLDPKGNATRAQIATTLMRYLQ